MTPDEIRRVLNALRTNPALQDETNLEGRAEALDTLRFVREAIHFLPPGHERRALAARATALRRHWQQIDRRLFDTVRAQIRSGAWRGARLRHELSRYTRYDGQPRRPHYDFDGLDVLVDGLLNTEPLPSETVARSDEMIHLESTLARVLLELVDRVPMGADDLFYDLGAGLGRVVILVHLLTGVRARGVEIQPGFCEYARRIAAQFALTGVEFICADAREPDYQDGTIFYLFTPFIGATLRTVLNRLQHVAALHPITLCTLGPCTPTVCAQPWLRSIDDVDDMEHEFKLAIFKSVWR